MSDILEPNFNGVPKPTDWKKVIVPLQQANEKEFRGATLNELGDEMLKDKTINGQRMKAVPPGALPAGPSDKEMYMVLESPGRWTFGGTNFDNVGGQIMTLWWNKTTYSVDNRAVLPAGKNGQGLLPLYSEVVSIPDFTGFLKNAQVRDDNGNVLVSKKDNNLSTLSDKSSWDLTSVANLSGTLWKCKEYNLNNLTGLVINKVINADGSIVTFTGGYLRIPITQNLWEKPIYIDGWNYSKFQNGGAMGNFAFYNDENILVKNGGVEYFGRYCIIPNGCTWIGINLGRNVNVTQADVNAIKVSISFNRINEEGKDCYITDIKEIANSVAGTHVKHNFLAFSRGWKRRLSVGTVDFYNINHLATQIVELSDKDDTLWFYGLFNSYESNGAVFYDKDWNIIGDALSMMRNRIPTTVIQPIQSFVVTFEGNQETIYETPFLIPVNARYVVFTLQVNIQANITNRQKSLVTISSKRLTASDFPILDFKYKIEKYVNVESFINKYDLKINEEALNLASYATVIPDRFNADGGIITSGARAKFDIKEAGLYSVVLTFENTSPSELGWGVYTDINDVSYPLNKSNFSSVVIGNNGDTWGQAIRVLQINAQSDWKSFTVNISNGSVNRYFAIIKGHFTGYLPALKEIITKEDLRLKATMYWLLKFCGIGDSIMHQMLWLHYLAIALGISPDWREIREGKHGKRPTAVGGSTVYPGLTNGKVTTPETNLSILCRADDVHFYSPKLILILAGANDVGKKFVIGNASNPALLDYDNPPMTTGIAYSQTNPNDITGAQKTDLSFASCYRRLVMKLMQNNPTAKIICMTPLGGNDGPRNLIEKKAIRQVILDICSDYGIQVIDTFRGVQINSITYPVYAPDGVHPSDAGGKLIAEYIVSQI